MKLSYYGRRKIYSTNGSKAVVLPKKLAKDLEWVDIFWDGENFVLKPVEEVIK